MLGRQISAVTGHDALYGSVPMVAVVAAISGSSVGAIGLIRERADGLLARLWVLPVHRASGLLSRFVAEAVRILVTTVVILCAGLMLGFRFHQGWLAALAWLMVPVIFGLAFATLVTTVAFYSATTTLVEAIALVNALAMFFCTGFVPLEQYPHWIQPVVEHQPMTYAIEAMRGIVAGRSGPVADDRRHCCGPAASSPYAWCRWSTAIERRACGDVSNIRYPKAGAQRGNVRAESDLLRFHSTTQRSSRHRCDVGCFRHAVAGPPRACRPPRARTRWRHQIVVDDLLHPGIWVVHGADTPSSGTARMRLDQSVSLANLRLKLTDGRAELRCTPITAWRMANTTCDFLRSCSPGTRTRCVPVASTRSSPSPRLNHSRSVLEQRGIRKQSRSGFERFMPAMFAYELPASTRNTAGGNPAFPRWFLSPDAG